jgi:hypothetical protein
VVVRIAADITRVIHKEPAFALARNSRREFHPIGLGRRIGWILYGMLSLCGSAASAASDYAVSPHAPGDCPTRIIWAMPRASLRSVLLICAFNTARRCLVSTQITGKPVSASALNSHCDSGPASSPIRLKWYLGLLRRPDLSDRRPPQMTCMPV